VGARLADFAETINHFECVHEIILAAIGNNVYCILGDNRPIAVQAVSDWMVSHLVNIDCLQSLVIIGDLVLVNGLP